MTSQNFPDEDVLKILIATDIHLGYAEEDPVRGQDTFDTFKEILQIGQTEKVDFVLLGGDLFHHAQPSPYCINKCMELLKEYCLGDKPVSIEFLSDPLQNFNQLTVNYEDPNVNISLPVFTIHGNHDDTTGKRHMSALDLLSTTRLVNYFGKWNSLDQVQISPILLQKGKSKLSLYGLSHIRDERLGRLFLDKKVKMLSPADKEDWFNLLVWHQNRATRGTKNFIPDSCLPNFLDMVIWGHEHDCRIIPEKVLNGVLISQPGSSVATSLSEGESITKHVGILSICGKQYKMIPLELKTVRPFKYAEMSLQDEIQLNYGEETSSSERIKKMVGNKLDCMIREAKQLGREEKVSEKPLIRLIVKYKNESNVFNSIRFGQLYTDKVANPESLIKFQLIRDIKEKRKAQNVNQNEDEEAQGPVLADRVEDIVSQYFTEQESLNFFPLAVINESVKKFIDSNDNNAIVDVTDNLIKEMLNILVMETPSVESTKDAIKAIKDRLEEDSIKFANKILKDPKRQVTKVANDNDDDDYGAASSSGKKPSARGRGGIKRQRGKGGAGSRAAIIESDEDDSGERTEQKPVAGRKRTDIDSEDDDVSIISDGESDRFKDYVMDRGTGRGRATTRGRRARGKKAFW